MSILISATLKVDDRNTRTVSTQKGDKQVVSIPIIKGKDGKWVYASSFINFQVNNGDILTISGRVEQKEDGQYLNNNFVFPIVERLYIPSQQSQTSYPAEDIPNIGEDLEINDDDLPF